MSLSERVLEASFALSLLCSGEGVGGEGWGHVWQQQLCLPTPSQERGCCFSNREPSWPFPLGSTWLRTSPPGQAVRRHRSWRQDKATKRAGVCLLACDARGWASGWPLQPPSRPPPPALLFPGSSLTSSSLHDRFPSLLPWSGGKEGLFHSFPLATLFQHEQVALPLGEKVQCNFKGWDVPGWKPVSLGDGWSGVWGQEGCFLGFSGPWRVGTCISHVGLSHSWAQLSPGTSRWGKVVKISTKSIWRPSWLCFWGCFSSSPTKLSQIFPECLEKLSARSISTERSMRQGMETSLVLPVLILHGAQHVSLEIIPSHPEMEPEAREPRDSLPMGSFRKSFPIWWKTELLLQGFNYPFPIPR